MARIDSALLERLRQKLGLSQSRIYGLIDAKVRGTHLPRNLAAIVLAAERGINISKFASGDDLAQMRQAAVAYAPSTVVVPEISSRRPAGRPAKRSRPMHSRGARRRGNTVFVVHGRDLEARDAIFAFLRALGLKPLEWNQVLKLTRQSSPYVGTILDTAFREAAAVVVLLTPDDEACLRKDFLSSHDPSYERRPTGQARPNVLFEAGMAFGRDPNSTVLVQIGDLRPFSDVAGRHAVRMSGAPTSRQELATKLANAGCNVDTNGTDWLSAGDFNGTPANNPLKRPRRKRRAF
jgi:predicted nucleotide-binding protein